MPGEGQRLLLILFILETVFLSAGGNKKQIHNFLACVQSEFFSLSHALIFISPKYLSPSVWGISLWHFYVHVYIVSMHKVRDINVCFRLFWL